jgi:hypothetical protein
MLTIALQPSPHVRIRAGGCPAAQLHTLAVWARVQNAAVGSAEASAVLCLGADRMFLVSPFCCSCSVGSLRDCPGFFPLAHCARVLLRGTTDDTRCDLRKALARMRCPAIARVQAQAYALNVVVWRPRDAEMRQCC